MNADHHEPKIQTALAHSGADPTAEPEVDACLAEAVAWYLERLEAGEQPDRQQVLAQYPELTDTLATCLDGVEFICRMAPAMRKASWDTSAASLLQAQLPARLGDFRIVRQIGRGGMGVVYEAEQLSLGRRVALKVLPFAAMLEQRQLERFKNEAQAAAMLRHSHIVAVHAVGCERGVHFYAMDLISGKSLAQVIEQLRGEQLPEQSTGAVAGPGSSACGFQPASDPQADGADAGRPTSSEDTAPLAALSTQHTQQPREFFRSI